MKQTIELVNSLINVVKSKGSVENISKGGFLDSTFGLNQKDKWHLEKCDLVIDYIETTRPSSFDTHPNCVKIKYQGKTVYRADICACNYHHIVKINEDGNWKHRIKKIMKQTV